MDRYDERREKSLLPQIVKILFLVLTSILIFLSLTGLSLGAYTIHVSSYKSGENANARVAELRAAGLEAYSRYESVPGKGMWHRVYVGNLPTRTMAQDLGAQLVGQRVISYFSIVTNTRPVTAASSAQTGTFDSLLPPPSSGTGSVPNQQYPLPPPQNQGYAPPNQAAAQPQQDPFASIPPNVKNQLATPNNGAGQTCPPGTACPPDSEYNGSFSEPEGCVPVGKEGFSLSQRTGVTFWPNAGDFSVTQTTGEIHRVAKPQALNLSLVPAYRFNDTIALEGTIEKEFGPGLDLWYLSLGPKAYLNVNEHFEPYGRVALEWGSLTWGDIPGGFNSSFGWSLGLGFDFPYKNFLFGMDFKYRGIEFGYNDPSDQPVLTNRDRLDLSGYTVTGMFGYKW